jgi:hypothetical protein
MILQTDSFLKPRIQKYGCYYLSILFFVNKYTGRGFDRRDINDLYDLIPDIWMDKDCYIKSPLDITRYLCFNVKDFRWEGADYTCGPGEFEILCWERTYTKDGKKKTYQHFVCGDGNGVVTYDPSGVSNAVKYGKLKSKRVFVWKSS